MEKIEYDICSHCNKQFSIDKLKPIPNFKGEVGLICDNCEKEVLDEIHYSDKDIQLQNIEDSRDIEW